LEDLENPQELLKSKKLRLAAFKEDPFEKAKEEEDRKYLVINLDEFPSDDNLKKENVKILKKLENMKNLIKKQQKEISEPKKIESHSIKLKNTNIKREVNRKRGKVRVIQSINSSNNLSINKFLKNSIINLKKNYHENQMHLSLSEIGSKNDHNSNVHENNKLNFSFSEAVETANYNNINDINKKNKTKENLNTFNNSYNTLDNLNNNEKITKSLINNNNKNDNIVESVSESINFHNLSKLSQSNKTEFSVFNRTLEKNSSQIPLNTFNFGTISKQNLKKDFENSSENISKIIDKNNINLISDLNLNKVENQNNLDNPLNYNYNSNLVNYSKMSSLQTNNNSNDNYSNNNLNLKINSEENLSNFSNLRNPREIKNNYNNNIIINNQNNIKNIIGSNNNANNNNNLYLNKKLKRDGFTSKSPINVDLFLKPKEVSTPMAYLERLLNENVREDLVNSGKLNSVRSNVDFSTLINNTSNQDLNNNIINNNYNNIYNYNINSLTNSISSGKNNTGSKEANKEITNSINTNLNLNENFQRIDNNSNTNINNSTKLQPIFNFNQISSFNFIKNTIEQRGTPVNLNTISSIHSNNFERNDSANANIELMVKNYSNHNLNYLTYNACANNNNNLNPISNAGNQNIISNISNLNSLYSLNNIINTFNNDNNKMINIISQSPRNLNLNNSNKSITSPKNLICELKPNPQAANNLGALANNIALNALGTTSDINNANQANNNQTLTINAYTDNNNNGNNNYNNNDNNNNYNNNYNNNNNSEFFNFMNLSGGLNVGLTTNIPHCIGPTPFSQQNNFSFNLNALNNPISPSAGNGFLNLSEITKYRNQLIVDYNNNLSLANSSILNFNSGNNTSTNSINNNLNNNNYMQSNFNSDFTSMPIGALRKQLNEINIVNNFKINQAAENEGDKTGMSLCNNRSNQVYIDEVNQMYNNLINKMHIIKNAKPDYYKECCDNYRNLNQDSEKRIYTILKIICDYERLYPDWNTNNILGNSIKNLNSNYSNINNRDGNLNELNTNTNRNSTDIFVAASTIKLDNVSSKNVNRHTNMNSSNNVTTCKSSPWLKIESINSFEDLAMSNFNKKNYINKISYPGIEGNSNRNFSNKNLGIVSPTSNLNVFSTLNNVKLINLFLYYFYNFFGEFIN